MEKISVSEVGTVRRLVDWDRPAPVRTESDWSSFGDRAMTWDDQGERDPRVRAWQANLCKLAALAVSSSIVLMIGWGVRHLITLLIG